MSDDVAVRRALADLARQASDQSGRSAGSSGDRPDTDYRETIERASDAVSDVEDAAEFLEETGLEELETAVERAEQSVSESAQTGRDALAVFRKFRTAAGDDQFRSARGTSLGSGDLGRSK